MPISVYANLPGTLTHTKQVTRHCEFVHELYSTIIKVVDRGGVSGIAQNCRRLLTPAASSPPLPTVLRYTRLEVSRILRRERDVPIIALTARDSEVDRGVGLKLGAVDDPSVRDRFLETVDKGTDRLIRLVNDPLLLSQVDSEALNLQRQTIDLVALVQDTVKRLSPGSEERRLALKVEASSGALMAWADPFRIDQVLVNLLDYALKYSRPGGTVTAGVEVDSGGTARVQVRDEGTGISPADLPHIGTRFYRAGKGRSSTRGGSGLGLAIAGAYVRANGGKLWLESRGGDGTLVSFTLPRP